MRDNINPDHYKSETSLECIEAMEIIFGERTVLNFCICNAWKYVWRWKNKNGIEDLHKAEWYVKRACHYPDVMPTQEHYIIARLNDYICNQINELEETHEES